MSKLHVIKLCNLEIPGELDDTRSQRNNDNSKLLLFGRVFAVHSVQQEIWRGCEGFGFGYCGFLSLSQVKNFMKYFGRFLDKRSEILA